MSSFTPVNQVRLTNVAVVRLKRGGKRFEIACYKNKVVNWRNGVEADLDEVLQIDSVFENVSRGVLAKRVDLESCFGTSDKEAVCKFILKKGQLQVSDKERQVANDALFRDIAAIVSEKCINAETHRPFTANMIEKTMRSTLHFAVKDSKTAKQQALEVIQQLKKHIPILRAQMRVRVTVPAVHGGNARAQLLEKFGAVIEDTDSLSSRSSSGTSAAAATNDSFLCKIQPGHFRAVDELVTSLGGQGVEVIDMHVQESGETDISNLKSAIAGMRIQDATSAARSFAGVAAVAEEDEDEDDNYAAPQKKSKKKKKKKKKKRRGRGQESKPHEEDVGLTGGGQPDESGAGSAQPVDLCGYMYCPYKSAYFVVSVFDIGDVNPNTKEPVGVSKWYIFGSGEKPALWNQQQKGWLVSRKFEDKLDVAGAIRNNE
jgi:ribosome maturation protein SDO1